MLYDHILDDVPIGVVYVGLVLLFLLSVEVAYRLGRARPSSDTSQSGTALGAMFALVGFLLAFTFAMAGSQYDARRRLVLEDANAIGTTYLRAGPLPEPHRSKIRSWLREYVADRHIVDAETVDELAERSEQLQQQLWAEATAVAQEHPTPIVSLLMQSLNEMIDLHNKRITVTLWTRIPPMIFATLALLSVLVMALIGHFLGLTGRRHLFSTSLLVVTYATVFLMVIDLDRPEQGMFQVSQQPMIDVRDSMRTSPEP